MKLFLQRSRVASVVLMMVAALSLLAEDKPAEGKPKVEETIVVTATRSARGVSELPVSTTVVTEEELKAKPSVFVDDMLRTVPGVHMPLSGSASSLTSGQRISMRGLGGTRALVLVDGLPIHDPYQGTIQWQKVPLDNLRQVEVVRGGNASLFGNFALGGTINMITRPIDESSVRLDTAYGSHNSDKESLSIDQMLTPALGMRVSHHRFNSDGFIRVPFPGPIDIDGWQDTAITDARIDLQHSESAATTLKSSLAKIDVSEGTTYGVVLRDIFDISLSSHRATGPNGLLSGAVFYQDQFEKAKASSVTAARDFEFQSQISDIPANVAGGSLEWSWQRSGVLPFLSFGVDVRQVDADEDRTSLNRNGAITQQASLTGSQRFAGIYAQASWHPLARMEILTSARFDTYKNFNGSQTISGSTPTVYPVATSKQLDPRVSVRYAVGRSTALRGSVYRAFKAPTLRELYRTTATGNSILIGNPYLEPETLVGGEVGVEWANARANVQVNLYRSEIEGLLARANVPGQPSNVFQNLNLGTSRSQGVEVMADVHLTPRWSVTAGYTYADSQVIEDPNPDLVGKLLPEVVPHIGSLAIQYRGGHGTTLDFRGRVLSRSYGEAGNLVAAPAHRVVDLAAAQPVRPWLDVYAMAENVFDEKYYSVLSTTAFRTGQPRTLTGGVRLHMRTRK
ncbi:MAG: TonB-dependent receptor [Acidobacteriota bacterium]